MAKYCHGSDAVDAFQWTADEKQTEDPQWIIDAIKFGLVSFNQVGSSSVRMSIHSPARDMVAQRGDWIICDSTGNITAARPDDFKRAYRPATEYAFSD